MGDNHTSIVAAISGKVESGRRAVYIDGELSHHIDEEKVVKLLGEARNSLWRTDPVAGADLGMRLYNLLNCSAGTLQRLIGNTRAAADKHTHLYLQVPYDLTQLPFELLHNGSFVLIHHNIHVIRLVDNLGRLTSDVSKREPLKMLFMACSPTDMHQTSVLKFEDEEERIFRATREYNIDMRVEDTGSIEGLMQTNIAGGGFDVIHITGHAALDEKMGPVFYMEDEVGKLRKVSPEMLWETIKDFPPRMLFLSGCLTGSTDERANSESFAYQMAQRGVRWVLGWGLPVSDDGATPVAAEAYRCLSIGKGVDYAVQSARRMVEGTYHPWPLLRLFGDAAPIVPLVAAGLPVKTVNPVTLRHKSLQDSKVRVLESGFVGRRRYVQQGVSVLRGKAGKYGLLVRGPAGIGKSCLVGKLVERVKDKELVVFHGVVSEADVTVKLRQLLKRLGNDEGLATLKSDKPYGQKIEFLFRKAFKNDISTVIYFDDFEQNLIRSGNEYNVKPDSIEVILPFLEAVDWAEGSSNVVISSRYPFILEADGEDLSRTKLVDLALISFDGADLDKKASNLEFVAKSSHVEMYLRYGGGNPRLLEWLDVIARDEARYDLKALETNLQDWQGEFIHEFLADVIAETVGEEFHGFIRRAAVYGEPVDATAFEAFGGAQFLDTGVDLTLVEREVRAALAIKDLSRGKFVYWVTPVIRERMWGELTVASSCSTTIYT
ncbi:MAG: CHAT domain-containing protein [Nitrospirae bacterium]|nr:CHAT domain-containing protein [Nitrospirota bacterium]